METRKKVADCACGQSRGMGLIHLRYGYATYTFGPAGCVAASRKLRNEGDFPLVQSGKEAYDVNFCFVNLNC